MVGEPILTAIDGSESGERALETAIGLAMRFDEELIIVNVEQGYLHGDVAAAPLEASSVEEILFAASSAILRKAQEKANRSGLQNIRTFSGLGDPASFIMQMVMQEHPEFVIIGRRGKSRFAGLLFGSVTQKLVALAPCKVLVVP